MANILEGLPVRLRLASALLFAAPKIPAVSFASSLHSF